MSVSLALIEVAPRKGVIKNNLIAGTNKIVTSLLYQHKGKRDRQLPRGERYAPTIVSVVLK